MPALQRFAGDFGLALEQPEWRCACCRPVADWLPRLEIVFLDLGLLLSLYSGYRIALTQRSEIRGQRSKGALTHDLCSLTSDFRPLSSDFPTGALKVFAPWAVLIVLLFAAGVWIVLQPMQMRGTFQG